ncbi:hypothetical protein VKT23_020103 [Stygiomarasmius scandens]|uniref:YDG domain-containing protein n=1 Tax=Marasmiellus scandens TaxID=2682957 RepID=A0ABR1IMI8_9AGAR
MVLVKYGHLEQFPIGSTFETREEMHELGMHPTLRSGIAFQGGNYEPACSIVVTPGQYCDDEDEGEQLTYTGAGGAAQTGTGELTKDQEWIWNGNKHLEKSGAMKQPVRVIRGSPNKKVRATMENSYLYPESGFRYDGLYNVLQVFSRISKHSNHKIFIFKLKRDKNQAPPPWLPDTGDQPNPVVSNDQEESDLEEAEGSSTPPVSPTLKRKRQDSEESSNFTSPRAPARELMNSLSNTSQRRRSNDPPEAGPSFAEEQSPARHDPHKDETSEQRQRRMAGNMKEKGKLRDLGVISKKKKT